MRNTLLALACGSILLAGSAALADDAQSGQPKLTAVNASSSTGAAPLVCKFIFHQGMLVRSSRCHTAAEWQNIRMHNQDDIRIMQDRALMRN